ncbi:hypothetical protein BO82DRAFT_384489 [Aspergillus uvarum CBS 121591]|uniref:Zn(2)-C6 fungal-type domain-containing protein n=1 Tax=Aspergillus uvarum CBS 121591 TaxID=1448315 RepID=A0A319DLZ6_9EURO|nr:hypothetical protein BO82DRAFT_384489 [Aspergillus uvarum CBS 121591]PYH80442.1 hypothetical protein BO82DRAFT_384489 [Aspergillus uvarum CBS 121591]
MEDNHTQGGSDAPRDASWMGANTLMIRACDACRNRKIRCNRQDPCSHCEQKSIECTYAEIRAKEKRTRIHFTPFYERKIDHIERQLDGIIGILQDLQVSRPDPQRSGLTRSTSTPSNESHSTPAVSSHAPQADSAGGPLVEGDSSLTAHSAFANDFLHNVLGPDPVQDCSLELRQTLDALAHTVATLKKQTTSSESLGTRLTPTPHLRIQRSELPPIEKAVALIRLAKSQSLAGTGWIYEFLQLNQFSDMCLGVYFSENCPGTDFITVNAGLHSLFWDYAFQLPEAGREEYFGHARLCEANLETALAGLPLHLPATSSTILALTFGAFHFVELSKPSMSWTYASKASELCQTLGYHRTSSMKLDSPETTQYKLFLFWGVYCLDKSLSLRLGRASTIPDGDITVLRPSANHCHAPVMAYFPLWIESARCQGSIYAMLYSPASIAQPDAVRQARVQSLVDDLHALEQATQETHNQWIQAAGQRSGEALIEFFALSDDVLRLSLLTLVHRAAPPTPDSPTRFSSNCIQAAEATLKRHLDCMAVIHKNPPIYFSKYIHWTLLFAPFSPFIVLFCHIIETQNHRYYLPLLQAFVESIHPAPTVSDAAARMYRLFLVLYNVARCYVECRRTTTTSQRKHQHQHQHQPHQPHQPPPPPPDPTATAACAEMDHHLAALGLSAAPSSWGDGGGGGPQLQQSLHPDPVHGLLVDEPMMRMGNEAELEGWFASNRAIMGLLQESSGVEFLEEF